MLGLDPDVAGECKQEVQERRMKTVDLGWHRQRSGFVLPTLRLGVLPGFA